MSNVYKMFKSEDLAKALEIAVNALDKLKECLFQGGEQAVKLGVSVVAEAALNDIADILGGYPWTE